MSRWVSLAVVVLLSACMVGPDYQKPEMVLDDDWHGDLAYHHGQGTSLGEEQWSNLFRDEQLRVAIETALANNRNMLIALEQIQEARARARISRAALYPWLDLDFRAEREEESELTNINAETADEFFFGPSMVWELDLWGANRRASDAAIANYLATGYGAQAVRLSLIAEVSRAYFELQGIQSRILINQNTLDAREQALEIAQKRFTGGLTSKLEVKQAEVELATTRSSLPKAEQRQLEVENQLSVLMGIQPRHSQLKNSLEDQYIPSRVVPGLPMDLLTRRPDIMRAEQELAGASEAVGVATAALLPNIRLTGSLGYETDDFDDLMDSDGDFWIAELDVAMPLFNAGARRAQLRATESRFNQARLRYEQVVLEAMREVSDTLNRFYKAGETMEAELTLELASTEYLELAVKRYRNGVLAYIDVLDAQRQLFNAQISVSTARQAQLQALVGLYRALGGGWDPASVVADSDN